MYIGFFFKESTEIFEALEGPLQYLLLNCLMEEEWQVIQPDIMFVDEMVLDLSGCKINARTTQCLLFHTA